MRLTLKRCAEFTYGQNFVSPRRIRLTKKAYHLQFHYPLSWSYARDVQNSIIQAYQRNHHKPLHPGYALRPTFITLQFKPVFTFGRDRNSRPAIADRRLLEELPGEDGHTYETRMAWERKHGWRFHGPGQLWCWMVCDMSHWHLQRTDVQVLMKSALSSIIDYYLPHHSSQRDPIFKVPAFKIPGSELDLYEKLTSIELHENKYKVISYGCSLNVSNDHLEGQSRLSRHSFESPEETTLVSQSWQNQEPMSIIHSRLVSELCRRLDITPEPTDIHLLASKLRTTIPREDVTIVRHRPGPHFASMQTQNRLKVRNEATPVDIRSTTLQFKRPAERTGERVGEIHGEPSSVPSWGEYVRKAISENRLSSQGGISKTISSGIESEEDAVADDGEAPFVSAVREVVPRDAIVDIVDEPNPFKPPPKVLADIIQWSTDVDFSFSPYIYQRKSVVSPRELRDHEYLGDPSRTNDRILDSETHDKKPNDTEAKRQIIQKMQLRGEDRI